MFNRFCGRLFWEVGLVRKVKYKLVRSIYCRTGSMNCRFVLSTVARALWTVSSVYLLSRGFYGLSVRAIYCREGSMDCRNCFINRNSQNEATHFGCYRLERRDRFDVDFRLIISLSAGKYPSCLFHFLTCLLSMYR